MPENLTRKQKKYAIFHEKPLLTQHQEWFSC